MDLDLDINSDIYTLEINDKFTAALASTLALDGSPDTGTYDQSGAPSLLDQYEYAMCGKLFKWKQEAPKVRHRRHRSRRSRSRSLATLTTRSHASYVLLLLLTRCACLLLLSRAFAATCGAPNIVRRAAHAVKGRRAAPREAHPRQPHVPPHTKDCAVVMAERWIVQIATTCGGRRKRAKRHHADEPERRANLL